MNIPSEDLNGIDKRTSHKHLVCTVFAGAQKHWTVEEVKEKHHIEQTKIYCALLLFSQFETIIIIRQHLNPQTKFPTNPLLPM